MLDIEFIASSGWFKRFNVKMSSESVSADVQTAEEFLETLDTFIEKENYLPEHIFTMDKTSLF